MGMFDTVVCRFPLPHHQDATFQTKDLATVALGEHCLSGLLDEYEITPEGGLRRHVHEREWTEDPEAFLGGYMRSVKEWWEDVPDVHGDVVMYTSEEVPGQQGRRWIDFRVRFTNGRVQEVHEIAVREPETQDGEARERPAEGAGEPKATEAGEVDDRPDVQELLKRMKASAAELAQLLRECSSHWGYEDFVYRFYHQSFKVYGLQGQTLRVLAALENLRPGHPLNERFRRIVGEGTGRSFAPEHNLRWLEETRPIVEAFFHARYFLEMVVRYGRRLDAPPRVLPSGWAALLELYGLR